MKSETYFYHSSAFIRYRCTPNWKDIRQTTFIALEICKIPLNRLDLLLVWDRISIMAFELLVEFYGFEIIDFYFDRACGGERLRQPSDMQIFSSDYVGHRFDSGKSD